jgi:hypothetical protein
VDGIKVAEGNGVSVSDTKSATLPAKVTFDEPPETGKVIRARYIFWSQDLNVEEIVSDLLTAADVTTGQQDIVPMRFPANSVLSTADYQSKAHWDTGTATALDTSRVPGQIMPAIDTAVLASAYGVQTVAWSTSMSSWIKSGTQDQWTSDATWLICAAVPRLTASVIRRDQAKKVGRFDFTFQFSSTSQIGFDADIGFDEVGNGVRIQFMSTFIAATGAGAATSINLFVYQNGTPQVVSTSWAPAIDTPYPVIVEITPYGVAVTVDGKTLRSSVPIAQIGTTMGFFRSGGGTSAGNTGTVKVRSIGIPADTISGTWVSPSIDWGATPSAWDRLSIAQTANGGTNLVEVRTSADNVTWSAYSEIPLNGDPTATLARYAQLRLTTSIPSIVFGWPNIDSVTLRSLSSSVLVLLFAMDGMSIFEAVGSLANLSNYEYGFNPDETFFFRPKRPSGVSVYDLNESHILSLTHTPGYPEVYSSVRATYGSYVREVGDDGEWKFGPLKRFIERRLDIEADSNIQFSPLADIATAVASVYYTDKSKVRRRFNVKTKFFAELNLADIVTLSYTDNRPAREWKAGDSDVVAGQTGIVAWGAAQQSASEVPCKVVGAKYDAENWTCELNLEEI